MKRKALLLVTVVLGLVMAGNVFAEDNVSAIVNVSVFSNFFDPDPIVIQVGDTVQWDNMQGFHNVNSTSGPEAFTSGTPSGANWTFSHTFTMPGTYTYVCDVHAGMEGTITVSGPTSVGLSGMQSSHTNWTLIAIAVTFTLLLATSFGVSAVKRTD